MKEKYVNLIKSKSQEVVDALKSSSASWEDNLLKTVGEIVQNIEFDEFDVLACATKETREKALESMVGQLKVMASVMPITLAVREWAQWCLFEDIATCAFEGSACQESEEGL